MHPKLKKKHPTEVSLLETISHIGTGIGMEKWNYYIHILNMDI